jgi:hypothetical protein
MSSVILVHPRFDTVWPFAADHARAVWAAQGPVEFIRLDPADLRPAGEIVARPGGVTRLVLLDVPLTPACTERFTALREIAWNEGGYTHESTERASSLPRSRPEACGSSSTLPKGIGASQWPSSASR